jgi:hypothetical protein
MVDREIFIEDSNNIYRHSSKNDKQKPIVFITNQNYSNKNLEVVLFFKGIATGKHCKFAEITAFYWLKVLGY